MLTFYSRVFIAPAMNPRMYNNPAVQENIAKLKERGFQFIGPEAGHVACGAAGMGRMSEPDKVMEILLPHLRNALKRIFKPYMKKAPEISPELLLFGHFNYSGRISLSI